MEEWRALAETVPGTLLLLQTPALEVSSFTTKAFGALSMRRFTLGLTTGGIVSPDPLLMEREIIDTDLMLQSALFSLDRHSELHHRAFRVFSLYGAEHLRLFETAPLWEGDPARLQGNRLWQRWAHHRANTLKCIGEVEQSLCSAQAYAFATADAVSVARGLPPDSPPWKAWMRAAYRLAICADEAISMQGNVAREFQMRRAVNLERNDAVAILHR